MHYLQFFALNYLYTLFNFIKMPGLFCKTADIRQGYKVF